MAAITSSLSHTEELVAFAESLGSDTEEFLSGTDSLECIQTAEPQNPFSARLSHRPHKDLPFETVVHRMTSIVQNVLAKRKPVAVDPLSQADVEVFFETFSDNAIKDGTLNELFCLFNVVNRFGPIPVADLNWVASSIKEDWVIRDLNRAGDLLTVYPFAGSDIFMKRILGIFAKLSETFEQTSRKYIDIEMLGLTGDGIRLLLDKHEMFLRIQDKVSVCDDSEALQTAFSRFLNSATQTKYGLIVRFPETAHYSPLYLEKTKKGLCVLSTDSSGSGAATPICKILSGLQFPEGASPCRIYVSRLIRQFDQTTCPVFCLTDLLFLLSKETSPFTQLESIKKSNKFVARRLPQHLELAAWVNQFRGDLVHLHKTTQSLFALSRVSGIARLKKEGRLYAHYFIDQYGRMQNRHASNELIRYIWFIGSSLFKTIVKA